MLNTTNTDPAAWKHCYCPQWETWNMDLDWRAKVPARHRYYLMRSSFVWRVSVILSSCFCNCSWCSFELLMKSSWDCKVALSSIFSSCSTCTGGRRNDCCKVDQTSLLQCDERLIRFFRTLWNTAEQHNAYKVHFDANQELYKGCRKRQKLQDEKPSHRFRPRFLRVPSLTSNIVLDCLNSSWTLRWSSRMMRLSSLRPSTLMLSLSTSSSLALMVSLALSSLLLKCWISERLASSTESSICFRLASWVCNSKHLLELNCKTTKVLPKLSQHSYWFLV